jgi:hypothetical protein
VAALLFDPALRPGVDDIVALSQAQGRFAVPHRDARAGLAELLRDGLAFDCQGLAPGQPLRMDTPLQHLTDPHNFVVADHDLVTLRPGHALAGARQLLPVVRILAGLVIALGALPGLRAVAWLPARLAMPPQWFAQAVGKWLNGGPFPALALTALDRVEAGLASRGLGFLIGQEFVWTGQDGVLGESDARGAVRLTDWLVAHGRIAAACEIELTGFGTVRVEPAGPDGLRVHRV